MMTRVKDRLGVDAQEHAKGSSHMKRRQFLASAGAGVAASTAVAMPAIAQSAPEVKWRCTSSFPKSLDTIYGAAELMAKTVSDAHGREVPDPGLRRG